MIYGDRSKEELNKYAVKLFEKVVNPTKRRELYDNLLNKFNMDVSRVEPMITLKRDIREFTPFEVFCVVYFLDRDCLAKYFTKEEIAKLAEEKFDNDTIEMPLVFDNMVQISEDQWIGKTTVQQIMNLKRGRLINYAPGEQRALQRVKFGKTEVYKPFVSNKNVREIKAAMEKGEYIPDPITLNMPEGSVFFFDNNTLTIEYLPNGMLNLDDGYHRYLAMSQIYDFDHSFNYPMELRIVNFANSKANIFIFQQDQKTPMKKIVSDTYNKNSVPNKIVQRINDGPNCNLYGMIGVNGENINSSVLAKVISYLYIKERIPKDEEIRRIISIKNALVRKLNLLTEQNELFLSKWSDEMTIIAMFVLASDCPEKSYAEKVLAVLGNLSDQERKLIKISPNGGLRKKTLEILKREVGDV